ncbi:MAG: hypothetical protein OEU92_02655 [Alphaproteobacteria bacterium]|nr:hypothetical protein [Alphaproteobacteria bacterium]
MAIQSPPAINDKTLDCRRGLLTTAVVLLAALASWRHGLIHTDVDAMSDIGLLSVLPPAFYAGVLLLTFSFCLSVTRHPLSETNLALHVVLLIVLLYALPMVLYDSLRLPWAWKHLGIIDYILRHGDVDPDIAAMPAYHNWPGFFALMALLVELAGRETLMTLAIWSPLAVHLVLIGVLALVFRTLTDDRQTVWMSIWIAYLANWVGQDYFSPQAFVFPLYLLVIGLSLAFLKPASATNSDPQRQHLLAAWQQFRDGAARTEPAPRLADPSLWLVAMVLAFLATMTISHPLTPAAMSLALCGLYALGRLKSIWPPLAAIVLFGAWLIGPARGFMASESVQMSQLIGDILANAATNFEDLTRLSPGQAQIAVVSRTLTGAVLLLALLGGITRLLKGRLDVSAALLVVTPFLILIIHSYDGEGLFRAYLFASPFLAFFAACLLHQIMGAISRALAVVFMTALFCCLSLGWLGAYYGKDAHTRTHAGEALAFDFLAKTAPRNSLVVEGSPNYPSRFRNYDHFTYVSIIDEPEDSLDLVIGDPASELGEWLDNERYTATYIILTESQKAGIEALGRLSPGTFDRLIAALQQSRRFQVAFENESAVIFILASEAAAQ